MDNKPDWNEGAVFVQVARSGSFTGAARALGMPISTVSAKVASLERRLGATLLRRTTRKLHLTEPGARFLERATQAISLLQEAEQAVAEERELRGMLRLTAPVEMGMTTLATSLARFTERHPGVRVDLQLTDRVVDLVGEGMDLAVRIGELRDSSLVSKKIGEVGMGVYAGPRYLERAPPIKKPQDLETHAGLLFQMKDGGEWVLEKRDTSVRVRMRGAFSSNNLNALHRLALEESGVALLPSFLCREDVREGRLVKVLAGWVSEREPIHLVYPAQGFLPARTRALLDWLAERLEEAF